MRPQWKKIVLVGCSILGGILGCQGERGRIRIDRAQATGVYEARFRNGTERLELKSDGTYLQRFASQTRPFQQAGKWYIESHVFGGSDIILVNAKVGEEDESRPLDVGDCRLNVHDRSGKLALARNEAMDFYYDRVQ